MAGAGLPALGLLLYMAFIFSGPRMCAMGILLKYNPGGEGCGVWIYESCIRGSAFRVVSGREQPGLRAYGSGGFASCLCGDHDRKRLGRHGKREESG